MLTRNIRLALAGEKQIKKLLYRLILEWTWKKMSNLYFAGHWNVTYSQIGSGWKKNSNLLWFNLDIIKAHPIQLDFFAMKTSLLTSLWQFILNTFARKSMRQNKTIWKKSAVMEMGRKSAQMEMRRKSEKCARWTRSCYFEIFCDCQQEVNNKCFHIESVCVNSKGLILGLYSNVLLFSLIAP